MGRGDRRDYLESDSAGEQGVDGLCPRAGSFIRQGCTSGILGRVLAILLCMQMRLSHGAVGRQTVKDRLAGIGGSAARHGVNAGRWTAGRWAAGRTNVGRRWANFPRLADRRDLGPILPELLHQRQQPLHVRYPGPEIRNAAFAFPPLRLRGFLETLELVAHAHELVGMQRRDDRLATPAEGLEVHGG